MKMNSVADYRMKAILSVLALCLSLTFSYAQKQMVQIKTFDEALHPMKEVYVSFNGRDFIHVGGKGSAFAEVSSSDLPPATVTINDEKLEAASWNYTKGVVEIIIRKKSYQLHQLRLVDENSSPLKDLKVTFKGKTTLTATSDENGYFTIPKPLNDPVFTQDQFTVDASPILSLTTENGRTTLVLKTISDNTSLQPLAQAQAGSSQSKLTLDVANIDSIQSLTVFYAVFKSYPLNSLNKAVRDKADAKFRQLVAELKDANAMKSETLFLGRISDSSQVKDDVANLIEQASTEGSMLETQRTEFDEKIKIITDKLSSGIENLDTDTRQKLLDDLNKLQALLAANEGLFYKNQNYYRDVILSLKDKYFDFEDIENKLFISEAQRLQEQKDFRDKLLLTLAIVVVFGVLIVRLIYISLQLKKEKGKLQEANNEIYRINENLEQLVYQRTKLLEDATRELDTFLYRASHDLRSPVCSIIGLCNLASHFSNGEAKDLLDRVVFTTSGMDRMLKKLSLISEINQPTNFSQVNVAASLGRIREDLSATLVANQLQFVINCNPDLIITTFPGLFDAILINLIENAVTFSAMKNTPGTLIEVRASIRDDQFRLVVRDNGVGIDSKITPKLFNMFFKGNVYSKGNGLGLYIVQRSVTALRGEVNVESTPGVYTQFSVSLPLLDSPPDTALIKTVPELEVISASALRHAESLSTVPVA